MTQRPPLFPPDPIAQVNRRKLIEETASALGPDVPREAARGFLSLSILPPSKRWIFLSLGKNASSSTLQLLFELEYGTRLTAHFDALHDINPSAVVHKLADTGVFARAIELGLGLDALLALPAERLLIVRSPYARAISAFRYFCTSDEMAASWFLTERLRANAMVGFDWETMPGTAEGLRRFLAYIEAEVAERGPYALNPHWCIQARSGFPDVYRPTLTGRLEALDDFYRALCDRLGQALPAEIARRNLQPPAPDALAGDAEARRMIERIYAEDFEVFGY
jgi:hypothetical protein